MDLIFINGLVFTGTHGVQKHEKKHRQRFCIDLAVSIDSRPAIASDAITDAVDYGPLRDTVRQVIEQESHNLIETIANRITTKILSDSRIDIIQVTIRKLDIWGNGTPGILITRPHGKELHFNS